MSSTTAVKKYKLCRRLGAPIFEKCQSPKFSETTGKARKGGPKRVSDFGRQLIEKQKVRFLYGVSEKQFKNYVQKAMKQANPARALFELLEMRLDSLVYRVGLAPTRLSARQFVTHGHTTVGGRRVDIPSYQLSIGDVVSVRESVLQSKMFESRSEQAKAAKPLEWVKFDAQKYTATVTGQPANPDPMLNFQAVIEFYTR
jgi:small subunit ribosomal protein S4